MAEYTVLEIIAAWLRANGYDGLYSELCGCEVDDLAPCALDSDIPTDCKAGYKHACTKACADDETGHEPYEVIPGDWHIGPRKPEENDG